MAVAQTFKVVSHFVFEESAFQGADKIEEKVHKISDAAKLATKSIAMMSTQFLASFTGVGGGIVGVLAQAFRASEKFNQSSLDFATIFASNSKATKGVQDFNQHLALSAKIMKEISQTAFDFALPEEDLMETVKGITAAVLPKVKAGTSIEKVAQDAVGLSRKALKAASVTGLDPYMMENFLFNTFTGGVHSQQRAFQVLQQDAPGEFAKHGVSTARDLNTMKVEKKMKLLNDVFDKFAKHTGLVELRVKSFTGFMTNMHTLFFKTNSVLKPLGDVLYKHIMPALTELSTLINTKVRDSIVTLAKVFDEFVKSPKQLMESLMTISAAGANFSLASLAATLVTIWPILKMVLGGLSTGLKATALYAFGLAMRLQILRTAFIKTSFAVTGFTKNLRIFVDTLRKLTILGRIMFVTAISLGAFAKTLGIVWTVLKSVVPLFMTFGGTLLGVFGLFQGISKGIARFKIEGGIQLANTIDKLAILSAVASRSLAKIAAPLSDFIDKIADLTYHFLTWATSKSSIEGLINMVKWLQEFADFVNFVYKFLKTILIGMITFVTGAFATLLIKWKEILTGQFGEVGKFFFEGWSEQMKPYLQDLFGTSKDTHPVATTQVTNEKVEIVQNFKEKVTPDRIAFAIVDVLKKTGSTATQGNAQGSAFPKLKVPNQPIGGGI